MEYILSMLSQDQVKKIQVIKILLLKNKIDEIDISKPEEVVFEYKHKTEGKKIYKTKCFVVLLSK